MGKSKLTGDNGENLVPKKHRALKRAVDRGLKRMAKVREDWRRCLELRKVGKGKRLMRKLMGFKPKRKMPKDLIARFNREGSEEE